MVVWVGVSEISGRVKGHRQGAGAEREVVGIKTAGLGTGSKSCTPESIAVVPDLIHITAPATDAAKQWAGFGTALKPSHEPICVARKPLEGTVASNVLKWGTGAINVDGCRVGTDGGTAKGSKPEGDGKGIYGAGLHGACEINDIGKGRWPANCLHDGSDEVLEAFAKFGESKSPPIGSTCGSFKGNSQFKDGAGGGFKDIDRPNGDTGTAARFFYTAKADSSERRNSKHPTVKPLDLMRYLVRLVTPPGGTVLEPFAGSGTTLEAAMLEHCKAIGIELSKEYCDDAKERLKQGVLNFEH